jgi:hypothetical protein
MEQHLCVVCGVKFDSGDLLMDMRLRDKFEMHTLTGWGMCPEHQKLKDDGFVAMVGCDESASTVVGNNVQPDEAHRTGGIAHLRVSAWEQIMDVPVPDKMVCFCGEDVIDMLKKMTNPEGRAAH